MMRLTVLFASLFILPGCGITGHYAGSGPCKGFHTNPKACERAAENSSVIAKVKLGQSAAEVLQVMGKDPERREATADTESWGYLTDYSNSLLTTILFKNGSVVGIKQTPSKL